MSLNTVLLVSAAFIVAATSISVLRSRARFVPRVWLIVAAPVAIASVAHLVVGDVAGYAFFIVYTLLVIAPMRAVRAAGRALRWGRVERARLLAHIAYVLNPWGAASRFRPMIEAAWALDNDSDANVEALAAEIAQSPAEARVLAMALHSWRSDFDAIVALAGDDEARALAFASGMTSVVLGAIGETGSARDFARAFRAYGVAARSDEDRTLLVAAAYLGHLEIVKGELASNQRDLPPHRVAVVLATAEQRAGRPEIAEQIVRGALATPSLSPGSRRRLERRLEHPLESRPVDAEIDDAIDALERATYARRELAALSLRRRQPAPLTWALLATLGAVFAWQSLSPDLIFEGSLIIPYEIAPEAHRIFTHAWLHADAVHFGVNALGLWFFGRFVEQRFGVLRFAVVYLLAAIGGGLGVLVLRSSPAAAVGASGAIFGLVGAAMAIVLLDRDLRRTREGRRELVLLGIIAIAQFAADTIIPASAMSAHFGGLVVGAIAGLGLGALGERSRRQPNVGGAREGGGGGRETGL